MLPQLNNPCQEGCVYEHVKSKVKYVIVSINNYGSKERPVKSPPIALYKELDKEDAPVYYRFVSEFIEIQNYYECENFNKFRFLYQIKST